jgi:hypothetical protein
MSSSLKIRSTIHPRSPKSGLKITGKLRPISLIRCITCDVEVGIFMRDEWAERWGGTFVRISNFDSPNMPPMGMPGLDAEKKTSERALTDKYIQ